jgi:hypothetical protein
MRSGTRVAAVVGIAVLLTAGGVRAEDAPATPANPPPAETNKPAAQPAAQEKAAQPALPDKFRTKGGELRVATLIGATVFNDQKQTIGNISDVLLNKDSKAAGAVLSVGGFLGVGSRLVIVPFGDLHVDPDRIVLPGATKVSLENLSAYQAGG